MRSPVVVSLVALLAMASATGECKPLTQTSDRELKTLCFRWFTPTFKEGQNVQNSWARRELQAFPQSQLVARLNKIQSQKIHYLDYTSVSFTLAYFGHDEVTNTRRLLMPENQNGHDVKLPAHVDWNAGNSPYQEWREPLLIGAPGVSDSLAQLYRHRRNPKLMAEIVKWRPDGENTPLGADMHRQLFAMAPVVYFKAAVDEHAHSFEWREQGEPFDGFLLFAEGTPKNRRITPVLQRIRPYLSGRYRTSIDHTLRSNSGKG